MHSHGYIYHYFKLYIITSCLFADTAKLTIEVDVVQMLQVFLEYPHNSYNEQAVTLLKQLQT